MKIRDITSGIAFTDQIYGLGHRRAPIMSFPRGNHKKTTYNKTALKRIAWDKDYIAQYVPLNTPNPEEREKHGGRICSLISIYPKEGLSRDFVREDTWNDYALERWPDAIMLREVFYLVDPPLLAEVYDDILSLTSFARGRLGEPTAQLYELLADREIVPVHELYRSPVALEYLQQIERNPTLQVVANRRTSKTGYVYALSLPEFPSMLKIGSAFDVSMRIAGLSTSVPTDFICAHSDLFEDCRAAERKIHEALGHARVRYDREWFKCSLEQLKEILQEIPGIRIANS